MFGCELVLTRVSIHTHKHMYTYTHFYPLFLIQTVIHYKNCFAHWFFLPNSCPHFFFFVTLDYFTEVYSRSSLIMGIDFPQYILITNSVTLTNLCISHLYSVNIFLRRFPVVGLLR